MNTFLPLGKIRPSHTTGDTYAEPFTLPLLRLRGHDRPVILPEACLVPGCLVCQWRRAGLLDHPAPRVVREHAASYGTCPSSYCPGCGSIRCVCPPCGFEDAVAEHAHALGHDHGLADGVDNRPTRRWCTDAGLDADAYLSGYDAACAGVVLVLQHAAPARLWDELDDGLPF